MTYKHNTPTFNVNRKVVNFKDFDKNTEEAELKKIKRQNKPNSERQQLIGNPRTKYNKVTHKLDTDSPAYIQDKIDAIKSDVNESVDNDVRKNIEKSVAYEKFEETLDVAMYELMYNLHEDKSLNYDSNLHYKYLSSAIFSDVERIFKHVHLQVAVQYDPKGI
jgi:hypothetical protein